MCHHTDRITHTSRGALDGMRNRLFLPRSVLGVTIFRSRASAHGAIDHRIDPSCWILVPASCRAFAPSAMGCQIDPS